MGIRVALYIILKEILKSLDIFILDQQAIHKKLNFRSPQCYLKSIAKLIKRKEVKNEIRNITR